MSIFRQKKPKEDDMATLDFVLLTVTDVEAQAAFYCDVLGMQIRAEGADFLRVGYDGIDADVVFRVGENPSEHGRRDRYWKIGITLPNVDIAAAELQAQGVDVGTPRQFQDIGYMCHFSDPAGYQIELLQHTFEGNRPDAAAATGAPFGGGAQVGQITLRTVDLAGALSAFRDGLGLRLLSVQPVTDYDFTLYFLAFTDDVPPGEGLRDVAHREWLWQRPYTTLELQHLAGTELAEPPGYGGIGVSKARPVCDETGRWVLTEDLL